MHPLFAEKYLLQNGKNIQLLLYLSEVLFRQKKMRALDFFCKLSSQSGQQYLFGWLWYTSLTSSRQGRAVWNKYQWISWPYPQTALLLNWPFPFSLWFSRCSAQQDRCGYAREFGLQQLYWSVQFEFVVWCFIKRCIKFMWQSTKSVLSSVVYSNSFQFW